MFYWDNGAFAGSLKSQLTQISTSSILVFSKKGPLKAGVAKGYGFSKEVINPDFVSKFS